MKSHRYPFFSKLNLACNRLNQRVKKGQSYEDAWNNTSVELVEIAELHGRTIIIEKFYDTVRALKRSTSKELWIVLHQLLQLYAVYTTLKCGGHLLRVRNNCFVKFMSSYIFFYIGNIIQGVSNLRELFFGRNNFFSFFSF